MFRIGNPNGGRVLFDGAMHGNEAAGSELLYSLAVWLLDSNDSLANEILVRTCTLLIPVVNVDKENIQRKTRTVLILTAILQLAGPREWAAQTLTMPLIKGLHN